VNIHLSTTIFFTNQYMGWERD